MKFATILADPPWRTTAGCAYDRRFGSKRSPTRKLAYPTMTVDEIAALPVANACASDALLFLWVTNGYLPQAFRVIDAWGFRYSTTLVWSNALIRVKQRARIGGTVFRWKRPYRNGKAVHSAKPPESYELIEQVAHGPYLELFSRAQQPRLGWAYWGNESLGTAELADGAAA